MHIWRESSLPQEAKSIKCRGIKGPQGDRDVGKRRKDGRGEGDGERP